MFVFSYFLHVLFHGYWLAVRRVLLCSVNVAKLKMRSQSRTMPAPTNNLLVYRRTLSDVHLVSYVCRMPAISLAISSHPNSSIECMGLLYNSRCFYFLWHCRIAHKCSSQSLLMRSRRAVSGHVIYGTFIAFFIGVQHSAITMFVHHTLGMLPPVRQFHHRSRTPLYNTTAGIKLCQFH